MGIKAKMKNALEDYVANRLLPVCYGIYAQQVPSCTFEEYASMVRERLKGEKE